MKELKPVYGSMFHTNFTKLQRTYFCDDDCEQSGCPGHLLELEINNTSGRAAIKRDGQTISYFGCNDAQALYEMLYILVNDK